MSEDKENLRSRIRDLEERIKEVSRIDGEMFAIHEERIKELESFMDTDIEEHVQDLEACYSDLHQEVKELKRIVSKVLDQAYFDEIDFDQYELLQRKLIGVPISSASLQELLKTPLPFEDTCPESFQEGYEACLEEVLKKLKKLENMAFATESNPKTTTYIKHVVEVSDIKNLRRELEGEN